jgi:ABC-type spermidine/putrescine transport system permease subunit I
MSATLTAAPARAAPRLHLTVGLLALPLILLLAVVYFYPVAGTLADSVRLPNFGLQQYRHLLESPVYMEVMARTFWLAVFVTVTTAVVGYPVAFYLTVASPGLARVALFLLFVPFWASTVVRTYGLMVILGRTGIVNSLLLALGLADRPVQFLFNAATVRVAMVQILLPFFVLPLYAVLRTIDRSLLQAALGLGARPWQLFRTVYLPLSMPGVFAGGLMVFVFSFGFFITPALLGGRREVTIAMLIMAQFEGELDWGFGAALSVVLLVVSLTAMLLAARVAGTGRVGIHG